MKKYFRTIQNVMDSRWGNFQYAGIENVKFKHSVFPGDTVCVKAKAIARKGPLVQVEAKATVEDKLVCQGKLSFMLVPKENLK